MSVRDRVLHSPIRLRRHVEVLDLEVAKGSGRYVRHFHGRPVHLHAAGRRFKCRMRIPSSGRTKGGSVAVVRIGEAADGMGVSSWDVEAPLQRRCCSAGVEQLRKSR